EEEQGQPPAELRNRADRGGGSRQEGGDSPGGHQGNSQALREGKRSGRRIQGQDELLVVRGGAEAGRVQGGVEGRTCHPSYEGRNEGHHEGVREMRGETPSRAEG